MSPIILLTPLCKISAREYHRQERQIESIIKGLQILQILILWSMCVIFWYVWFRMLALEPSMNCGSVSLLGGSKYVHNSQQFCRQHALPYSSILTVKEEKSHLWQLPNILQHFNWYWAFTNISYGDNKSDPFIVLVVANIFCHAGKLWQIRGCKGRFVVLTGMRLNRHA
jgi:hypothetical protein